MSPRSCSQWLAAVSLCATVIALSSAIAGTAALSWTNPTTYTDGTTFPASDFSAIRIEYGQCDGVKFTGTVASVTVPESATSPVSSYTFSGLSDSPPGGTAIVYCFRAFADSIANGESSPTGIVSKTMPAPPPPSAPSNLTVVALTAYTVVKETDRFVMVPVGTVPAGTACDASQSVNGYNVVPRASVTWAGDVRPVVVVAQCGA